MDGIGGKEGTSLDSLPATRDYDVAGARYLVAQRPPLPFDYLSPVAPVMAVHHRRTRSSNWSWSYA
jgi:hypothetical protein